MSAAVLENNAADPFTELRYRCHGQIPPVTAQLAYYAYAVLPREVCTHPGSREYKNALRELYAGLGLPLSLTRKDIAHGTRFLHANGLLPEWVNADGFGGVNNANR